MIDSSLPKIGRPAQHWGREIDPGLLVSLALLPTRVIAGYSLTLFHMSARNLSQHCVRPVFMNYHPAVFMALSPCHLVNRHGDWSKCYLWKENVSAYERILNDEKIALYSSEVTFHRSWLRRLWTFVGMVEKRHQRYLITVWILSRSVFTSPMKQELLAPMKWKLGNLSKAPPLTYKACAFSLSVRPAF